MRFTNRNVISVKGLKLKFPGEARLQFESIDFHAREGEKVLLLGPSGCGKSTLLAVLSGIIPHSLEVPIKAEQLQIPESVGYVFQDPDSQFCMPYVDEELAFILENRGVPREQMDERIQDALAQVGLEALAPHTLITELSQGMKQRVAIASVYLLEPQVWFLDEPTALLDGEGTEQIWQAIQNVTENATILIVEHKTEIVADWVDRVVFMDRSGNVVDEGPPTELFSRVRGEMQEAGIWYPGVWEDYLKSRQYESLMADRRGAYLKKGEGGAAHSIHLSQFEAHRKKRSYPLVSEGNVASGEWIAITGPNGAGKSTLLLALRQLLPTSGSYLLHGQPIEAVKQLERHFSFVFQNPELQFIESTVQKELELGLRLDGVGENEVREEALKWLATYALEGQAELHPYLLSLGQKRRLSVAGALIRTQQILLLDEPTFGQDAQNTFYLLEEIERWRRRGTIVIMVTHDERIVEHFATRVWGMRDGRLVVDRAVPQAQGLKAAALP